MVALRLVVVSTGSQFTDIRMQLQVLPGRQLNTNGPDGGAIGLGKAISQVLFLLSLANTPLQINIKATSKYGSQSLSELASITSLPQS
jgi:hypothetical protein